MSFETVDMFLIARLDDDVAVADLYSCEIHYDATDGTEAGPTVGASWGSVTSEPNTLPTLGALDQALTELGYRRRGAVFRQRDYPRGGHRPIVLSSIQISSGACGFRG
ncbi:hypothetical protein AB0M12_40250 [Nocardia vinacea]|uniref:hypothetical protein n=1 Tax=Nocardia vinacea TaxID=96468 RepID=UPI0034440009